ncbi:hypothetical protein [Paractinoplanes atraurantiacus]|uniref:Uncharacterized protein n=1 Tax=Paractinoplanes atraurantiacus TaxID=1036182 RepID=A0A285I2S7_9ACTN|nr:hypothetical protein [Actinoplanes atraurantiacus]SNY42259.1 hypothetical protein SAMN05421748_106269 [Actinoplanes atraurantiacus]
MLAALGPGRAQRDKVIEYGGGYLGLFSGARTNARGVERAAR